MYELCVVDSVFVSYSGQTCWVPVIVLRKGAIYIMTLPDCLLCLVSCAFLC